MAPNVRHQLLEIGIGDFNATQIIPLMFKAPAQVDAGMPAIILLTEAIQRTLNEMGANLLVDGVLYGPTIVELRKITGRDWPSIPLYAIVGAVISARKAGYRFTPGLPSAQQPAAVGFIPAPPGNNLITWALIGGAAWWILKGRHKGKGGPPPAQPRRASSTARTVRSR